MKEKLLTIGYFLAVVFVSTFYTYAFSVAVIEIMK